MVNLRYLAWGSEEPYASPALSLVGWAGVREASALTNYGV